MACRRVLDPYVTGVVLMAARVIAVAVLLARRDSEGGGVAGLHLDETAYGVGGG